MITTTADKNPLLEMKGITKRFPGVLALNQVDLELERGEILGLIGENGAGKSTLMRILGGDYPADEGNIVFEGENVVFHDVLDSIKLGISLIHQELNLATNLDIASNIYLGREPRKWLFGIVDKAKLYSDAEELAKRVGLNIDITTLVEGLSPGERQLVEIAKALSLDAKILVLDEPTSSLTLTESKKLFELMANLKNAGVAMIYISHRLSEVEKNCDRVVVLRDGERVGELRGEDVRASEMVKLMVGRDVGKFFPQHKSLDDSEPILKVEDLVIWSGKSGVSFSLKKGEILGIAGLVGSGRTELANAIFGVMPIISGSIHVSGYEGAIASPIDAIRAGIGFVPEDRKALGIILQMSVEQNITLAGIGSYKAPFLDRVKESQVATQIVDELDIKTPGLQQEVQFLSGGNQQKVALGKWLSIGPQILILDEPTRGIDVGSKQ